AQCKSINENIHMSKSLIKFINFAKILEYLTSRTFLKNIALILLFLFLVIFSIFQWLKVYTHHGQRLLLENYSDRNIEEARIHAEKNLFQLIVNDSTHIVGKPGGIILNQNPKGGAFIKENRKIYVTITKYNPDMIQLKDLPRLYGENYEMKSRELNSRQLKTRIMSTKYDPIGSFTILEVWYNGEKIVDNRGKKKDIKIEKGAYLDLVVSQPDGGSHVIPQLVGKTLDAAYMIAQVYELQIGEVAESGDIKSENRGRAIVTEQYPTHDGISSLTTGEKINLVIASSN
ncbi:MAG: hypothetical protein V3V00_00700, partial [Saprospiraceae bacterium]